MKKALPVVVSLLVGVVVGFCLKAYILTDAPADPEAPAKEEKKAPEAEKKVEEKPAEKKAE